MTSKTFKSGKTWSIGAKKYAISNPSAAIALRYGANVSRGIGKMEDKIESLEREIGQLSRMVAKGRA